ncbi:peptidase [bacterium]|nr:MAG: peptidase [bacterium]
MKNAPGLIEIFRAGKHVAVDGRTLEFSAADIAQIASNYDPALSEAPMVVGHPQLNAPAYGWAKSLRAEGDMLYAEPHQVDAQFAALVNAGRYKKRSASIFLPDTPGNPTPGKMYLRHIGFLGAAAPAVTGLRDAQFADGGAAVEFAMPASYLGRSMVDILQRVRDWFVETQGAEKADQIIPQWQLRSLDDMSTEDDVIAAPAYAAPANAGTTLETDMSENQQAVDFAAREAGLNTRQSEIEAREKAIADRETADRRTAAVSFAAQLVTDGKLLPRHKEPVVELLMAFAPDKPLEFAAADGAVKKPGAEVLRELLDSLPKQINYAEKSGADNAPSTAEFAAPVGTTIDAGRADIYARAKQYQAQNPNVDWLAAVRAVGG